MLAQEVGGRIKHVGLGVDQVAAAVAVAVDGEAQVVLGEELRLADFAGPGAAQLLGLHVAAVDDGQRREQLFGEEGRAAAVIGQRRQRVEDVHRAGIGAEAGLHAPDGDDDLLLDAVALLDVVEQRGVLLDDLLALGHEGRRRAALHEGVQRDVHRVLVAVELRVPCTGQGS